jgi:hypothetical protein
MINRLVVLFIALQLMLVGCSFNKSKNDTFRANEEAGVMMDVPSPAPMLMKAASEMPAGGAGEFDGKARETQTSTGFSEIQRKVIYIATMRIEVEDYEKSVEKIMDAMKGFGGFIADSQVSEEASGRKTGSITLKIPQDKFEDAIKSLSVIGKVKDLSQHGQDITEEYVDMEARLNNAKRMETRLVELLNNKDNKLKDMLEVEKELGRVREEIDRLEGKKRYFDSRVALSTITLTLFEPQFYATSIFDPVGEAIHDAGGLFMSSLGSVVKFLSAAVPWLVLVFFFIWMFVKLVKRWWRRIKDRGKSVPAKDDASVSTGPQI